MSDSRPPVLGLVWNDEEARLRAPLRLVAHAVAMVGTLFGVALPFILLGTGPPTVGRSPLWTLAVNAALLGGVAAVVSLAAAWLLDRRRLADLGLGVDRAWWRDLGAGLALGAALQAGVFGTALAAGWTTVERVGGPGVAGALVVGAVLMAWVGFYEELLFRGYYLVNVAEGLVALPRVDARRAVVAAAALTAVPFGAVHAANPGATAVSTALVVVYGGYLALGFLLTGDLALPVGFHAAWNYAQGFVFGFPVSGTAVEASLVATSTSGPTALTGGAFGPEAGLVGLAWVAASVPVVGWWVHRTRGEVGLHTSIAVPTLRREP